VIAAAGQWRAGYHPEVPGAPLNGALGAGGDPAPVEIALLSPNRLVVEIACIDPPRIEREIVADRLVAGTRLRIGTRNRRHRFQVVAGAEPLNSHNVRSDTGVNSWSSTSSGGK